MAAPDTELRWRCQCGAPAPQLKCADGCRRPVFFRKALEEETDPRLSLGQAKTATAADLMRVLHGDGTDGPLPAADMVNRPAHYNKAAVEAIDGIKAALGEAGFRAYCVGNALKYLWRCQHKGAEQQDLEKAAWYARMAAGDDPREANE